MHGSKEKEEKKNIKIEGFVNCDRGTGCGKKNNEFWSLVGPPQS